MDINKEIVENIIPNLKPRQLNSGEFFQRPSWGWKFPFVSFCSFNFRPNLSWRDVQHIIVRSARPGPVKGSIWNTNNAGLKGRCVTFYYGENKKSSDREVVVAYTSPHVNQRRPSFIIVSCCFFVPLLVVNPCKMGTRIPLGSHQKSRHPPGSCRDPAEEASFHGEILPGKNFCRASWQESCWKICPRQHPTKEKKKLLQDPGENPVRKQNLGSTLGEN